MAPELCVNNVSWGPRGGAPIIAQLSFTAPAGAVTVIVGPNGAGKSSLLRTLYRHHRPLAGTVLLDGEDVWRMDAAKAARRIAAVLQESSAAFPFTVTEVVEMGRIPHQRALLSGIGRRGQGAARDRLIVAEMIDRFELTTLADAPFSRLSGGEKQRVLLARAMAQEPGVIILDEPTNHLDIRCQLELLQILRQSGLTVIATVHDLGLAARVADQIVVMRDGRLRAVGAPQQALTPEVIREVFGVTAAIELAPASAPDGGRMRFAFALADAGRRAAGHHRDGARS